MVPLSPCPSLMASVIALVRSTSPGSASLAMAWPNPVIAVPSLSRLSPNASAAAAASPLSSIPSARASSRSRSSPLAPSLRNGISSAPERPNSRTAASVLAMPSGILENASATLASPVSAVSSALTPICCIRLASSLLPVCASTMARENLTRPPVSCSKLTPDCCAAYFRPDSASVDIPTFWLAS